MGIKAAIYSIKKARQIAVPGPGRSVAGTTTKDRHINFMYILSLDTPYIEDRAHFYPLPLHFQSSSPAKEIHKRFLS